MSLLFQFKQFDLKQSSEVFKLTTDATLLAALLEFPYESREYEKGLEIGTGTGVVSMMLAQRFPFLTLKAIDVNSAACTLAQQNIQDSQFASRIQVFESDFKDWKMEELYDVIVTNPPYFDNSTISSKSEVEALARHQIGLTYEDLIMGSSKLLRVGGLFQIIFPYRYEEKVRSILRGSNLISIKSVYIMHHENAKPKNMIITAIRISLGFETLNLPEKCSNFHIRKISGEFSEEYKLALKDFLLAF